MSIDDLLDECADRGWLVNNLFQRDDGSWQANLRTATRYTAYGRGPSADIALSFAMDGIEDAKEYAATPALIISMGDLPFGPKTNKSLSEILNLPKPTFKRML